MNTRNEAVTPDNQDDHKLDGARNQRIAKFLGRLYGECPAACLIAAQDGAGTGTAISIHVTGEPDAAEMAALCGGLLSGVRELIFGYRGRSEMTIEQFAKFVADVRTHDEGDLEYLTRVEL